MGYQTQIRLYTLLIPFYVFKLKAIFQSSLPTSLKNKVRHEFVLKNLQHSETIQFTEKHILLTTIFCLQFCYEYDPTQTLPWVLSILQLNKKQQHFHTTAWLYWYAIKTWCFRPEAKPGINVYEKRWKQTPKHNQVTENNILQRCLIKREFV